MKNKKLLTIMSIAALSPAIVFPAVLTACSGNQTKAPTALTIVGNSTVLLNSTAQYSVTVTPSDAIATCTWSVNDTTKATIDATGKLTTKAAGSIIITATSTVNTSIKAEKTITITAGHDVYVTLDGQYSSNVKIDGKDSTKAVTGQTFTATLTSTHNFRNKVRLSDIKVNGATLTDGYTFDKATGKLTINGDKITGDVVISPVIYYPVYKYEQNQSGKWILAGFTQDFLNLPSSSKDQALGGDVVTLGFDYEFDSGSPERNFIAVKEGAFIGDDGTSLIPSCLEKLSLPGTCKTIGENAFKGWTTLDAIAQMKGVTSIGESAFEGCTSLTNLELTASKIDEDGLAIGPNTFKGCSNLATLTLSPFVSKIDQGAFANCNSIKKIRITDITTVDEIPTQWNLSNMGHAAAGKFIFSLLTESADLDSFKTYFGQISSDFNNWAFERDPLFEITTSNGQNTLHGFSIYFTNYSFDEEKQKKIFTNIFGSENRLVIPKNINKIANSAFSTWMLGSTIPDFAQELDFEENSVCSSIGGSAFYDNPFVSITLPSTVTTIEANAFGYTNAGECDLKMIDIRAFTSIPSGWDKTHTIFSNIQLSEEGSKVLVSSTTTFNKQTLADFFPNDWKDSVNWTVSTN